MESLSVESSRVREILRTRANLPPDRLELLKEIEEIRKSIGPISSKVRDLVRELREYDGSEIHT